ncbi:MAG: two component transcriptional regulator, winged helix family [Candidatus Saccharibacteria bacterium]|nr:two component transcriptional regulator, winged helix family [Candidatus Saccharibacteria bacterium]
MRVDLNYKILLIDDDVELSQILAMQLRASGFYVEIISDGATGYEMAASRPYDLIILDITMPRVSGLDICKELRARGVLTPILLLSGITDKDSIVRGLEYGADDYLTKPFTYAELHARVSAQIRRNRRSFIPDTIEKYGIKVDLQHGIAVCNKKTTQLTPKEAKLLRRLMYDAPQPVERHILLEDVWGIDHSHTSNRLDAYIKRIRQKLTYLSGDPMILTFRGRGYCFGQTNSAAASTPE